MSSTATAAAAANHDRSSHHTSSTMKLSSLLNSNSSLTAAQHQQLLTQLIRLESHKKNQLSSSTLASLLQSKHARSLSNDSTESLQPKLKRFKGADLPMMNSKKLYRKQNVIRKKNQLFPFCIDFLLE